MAAAIDLARASEREAPRAIDESLGILSRAHDAALPSRYWGAASAAGTTVVGNSKSAERERALLRRRDTVFATLLDWQHDPQRDFTDCDHREICRLARTLHGAATRLLGEFGLDLTPERAPEDAAELRAIADAHKLLRDALEEGGLLSMPSGDTERAALLRLADVGWWRRQLNAALPRRREQAALALALVRKRRSAPETDLYCSREAVQTHAERQERALAFMRSAVLVDEDSGEEITLANVAATTVADPRIRFAEMMTRLRGMQRVAQMSGLKAAFITNTCPGHMHPSSPTYDGTTMRAAQQHLVRCWAQFRTRCSNAGIPIAGMRTVEAHHDGCPHWHGVIWYREEDAEVLLGTLGEAGEEQAEAVIEAIRAERDAVRAAALAAGNRPGTVARKLAEYRKRERHALGILRDVFLGETREDPGAVARRVDVKLLDREKGDVAGYLIKYITKHLPAGQQTEEKAVELMASARLEAWRSLWGIKAFAFFGEPGVGIWRELWRLKGTVAAEHDGLQKLARSVDRKRYAMYVLRMGGLCAPRSARPFRLAREDREGVNAYGEALRPRVVGVEAMVDEGASVVERTRLRRWRIDGPREIAARKEGAAIIKWEEARAAHAARVMQTRTVISTSPRGEKREGEVVDFAAARLRWRPPEGPPGTAKPPGGRDRAANQPAGPPGGASGWPGNG